MEDDIEVIARDLIIELVGRMDRGAEFGMGEFVPPDMSKEWDEGYFAREASW